MNINIYQNTVEITAANGREVKIIIKSIDKEALEHVTNAVLNSKDKHSGSLVASKIFEVITQE